MIDRDGFEERRAEAAAHAANCAASAWPIRSRSPAARSSSRRKDNSRLHVSPDGTITLYSGIMSVGQGTETAFSNLVAERLGVPVENVVYSQGDTDNLPGGRGNGGSSATPVGASSVAVTVDNLIEAAGRSPPKCCKSSGQRRFRRRAIPGPRRRQLDQPVRSGSVCRRARRRRAQCQRRIRPDRRHLSRTAVTCARSRSIRTPAPSRFVNYCVCEDIGRVLNPTLAAGQMHGGIAQGAGQALLEQAVYDPDSGQLVTGSFMDYTMPRADDLPTFTFTTREVPTMVNPIGAKGIGEAGSVGSIVATINAVCDALAPLGIKHIEMPATPDRIWSAIQTAQSEPKDRA